MRLDEQVTGMLEMAHDLRDEWTREHGANGGLRPVLDLWRGDQVVATVFHLEGDRDDVMTAMRIGIIGFSADAAVSLIEGWGVVGKDRAGVAVNPDTGKEWGIGEMQEYVKRHGRTGLVRDCLHVAAMNSAGDAAGASQVFLPKGRKNIWEEAVLMRPGQGELAGSFGNIMSKSLDRAHETAPFQHLMAKTAGQSQEAIRAACDCAAAQMLTDNAKVAVSLSCTVDQDERRSIIEDRFGPSSSTLEGAFEFAQKRAQRGRE